MSVHEQWELDREQEDAERHLTKREHKGGRKAMRYRKKPVEIEARQTGQDYDEDCAIVSWCGGRAVGSDDDVGEAIIAIDTLEGTMLAEPGDWIIKGVAGEFYPCKPEIFEATYEPVD